MAVPRPVFQLLLLQAACRTSAGTRPFHNLGPRWGGDPVSHCLDDYNEYFPPPPPPPLPLLLITIAFLSIIRIMIMIVLVSCLTNYCHGF